MLVSIATHSSAIGVVFSLLFALVAIASRFIAAASRARIVHVSSKWFQGRPTGDVLATMERYINGHVDLHVDIANVLLARRHWSYRSLSIGRWVKTVLETVSVLLWHSPKQDARHIKSLLDYPGVFSQSRYRFMIAKRTCFVSFWGHEWPCRVACGLARHR